MAKELRDSVLGKAVNYSGNYDPALLFAIPRSVNRAALGIHDPLPFHGVDLWNAFELSWLNSKGKPQIALAEIQVPCNSPYLIESKSLKLYLNSFNQSKFIDITQVYDTLQRDLSIAAGVTVDLSFLRDNPANIMMDIAAAGTLIDDLDLAIDTYEVNPDFLSVTDGVAEETLISHLLKSNCLATGQPDWATIFVRYRGPAIERVGLLKYIISYRQHQGFHEYCLERMFMDILHRCQPTHLTVYARYTRRGGLDINPFRSNFECVWGGNQRVLRQ